MSLMSHAAPGPDVVAQDRDAFLADFARFCEAEIAPHALAVDREGCFPHEAIAALRRAGHLALAVPKDYGGGGAGVGGDLALLYGAARECARWCTNTAHVLMAHLVTVCQLTAMGTETQKRRFLPEIVRDGTLWGSWFSETGRSLLQPDTVARRVEGGYVVNGRKFFSTNSVGATHFLLWCTLEGGTILDSLLLLAVSQASEGVEIVDDWDGMGQRGTASGTTIYRDVFVPDENLLGGEANAFYASPVPQGLIFQLGFASIYQGAAEGAFAAACRFIEEKGPRIVASYPGLSHDPYVQLHVGDMAARIEAGGLLIEKAVSLVQGVEHGTTPFEQAALAVYKAKVFTSDLAVSVTHDVFRLCGTSATLAGHPFEMFWRNMRTLTLHDPVDRRREVIGKALLGIEAPRPFFL